MTEKTKLLTEVKAVPKKTRIKDMTPEQRKEYQREKTAEFRDRQKAKLDIVSRRYTSDAEISKKDARRILLEERGLRNQHVIDVCVELAEVAARHHKLPYSSYLFTHGLRALLKAREDKKDQPVPEVADEQIPGELIFKRDAYALWDYSMFRQDLPFELFLVQRNVAKTDCFLLGRDILGKDFHDTPHGNWAQYFPRFRPDLKPNYSQEEMKAWLGAQNERKDFLLIASRNSYKSSFSIVWLVSAILCCPDLRALLVSETKPLSRGFIKALRGYFEVKYVNEPTKFQQLFPEYCIPTGDGSTQTFECPMGHLGLIQSTAEATSMDSTVAGNRADLILFDDPISNVTCGNETQRQASIDKYDLLRKLLEVGGYVTILGTPWHVEDLYATLLKRNAEDPEHPLAFRIDPAWMVKPTVLFKNLEQLVEDDVVLLFPTRLTWKFLQKEMKASKSNGYRFFRSQNLCEFVPEDENEIKLHFDPDQLTHACIPQSALPAGDTILSVDIAYSMSARADLSSIAVVRLFENTMLEKCMGVMDVEADRLRGSELAHRLVMLTRRYNPRVVLIEQGPTSDSLRAQIEMTAAKYETSVPLHFVQPSNIKNAKFLRIKDLELLLSAGRLKFANGAYIDALFAELQKLDGAVSSSKKKDDRADAIAQVATTFRIYTASSEKEPSAVDESELEKMQMAIARKAHYERMFGGTNQQQKKEDAPPPPERVTDPRLAQAAKILPPGMRI